MVFSVAVIVDIQWMVQCVMVSDYNSSSIIPCYNWTSLTDINECDNTPRPCGDVCTNTEGSYMCSCSDHSERVTEDGECVGKEI